MAIRLPGGLVAAAPWHAAMAALSEAAEAAYRALVHESPELVKYFHQATPIDEIGRLRRDVGAMQSLEVDAGRRFRDLGMAEIADDDPPATELLDAHIGNGSAWIVVDAHGGALGYALASIVDDEGHLDQVSVAERAGRLFWLNPEPRLYWNYGDSVMAAYERYCDGAFECWTTRHLENFVNVVAGGTPATE